MIRYKRHYYYQYRESNFMLETVSLICREVIFYKQERALWFHCANDESEPFHNKLTTQTLPSRLNKGKEISTCQSTT